MCDQFFDQAEQVGDVIFPDLSPAGTAGSFCGTTGLANPRSGTRRLNVTDLTVLPPEQLRTRNLLYSSGQRAGWRWHLNRLAPEYWVCLEHGTQHIWLGLCTSRSDADTNFNWREYQDELRLIAWAASHAALLEAVQIVFGGDCLPLVITSEAPASTGQTDAGFVLRSENMCVATGHCRASSALLDHVTGCDTADANSPVTPLRTQIPVPLAVVVDRTTLCVSELQRLTVGAVARIRRGAFANGGGNVALRAGHLQIIAHAVGPRLTVQSINTLTPQPTNITTQHAREITLATTDTSPPHQEPLTAEHTEGTQADENNIPGLRPIDLQNMPVAVRFEAGCINSTFAELANLQPGYTFDLGCLLADHTINITANGALITQGELVAIGSELGVRITAMARTAVAEGDHPSLTAAR